MLHCAERTLSRQACAEGRFHGYFFVRSPLTVDLVVLYGFFGDLRTGSSRVAGDKAATRLEETAGNRLVAQHQLSHSNSLLLCIIIQCHSNCRICVYRSRDAAASCVSSLVYHFRTLQQSAFALSLPAAENDADIIKAAPPISGRGRCCSSFFPAICFHRLRFPLTGIFSDTGKKRLK